MESLSVYLAKHIRQSSNDERTMSMKLCILDFKAVNITAKCCQTEFRVDDGNVSFLGCCLRVDVAVVASGYVAKIFSTIQYTANQLFFMLFHIKQKEFSLPMSFKRITEDN